MPEPALAVEARAVTKVYDQRVGGLRLRDALPGVARRPRRPLVALDHVDLDIAPGESVGIIGPNGAGKSTLLKLVAGVSVPSTGAIRTAGRVASMIELELGFHPELTGRENVLCSAVMLGLDRRAARELAPVIHDFSGLRGGVLDQPLRTYSTGMRARLGFAVASHVHADVLVVDEVLTVGDREFQLRCLDRVAQLVAGGTTLLFVSHAMDLVGAVCARAVHLRRGALVDDGPAVEVVERYLSRSPSRHRRSADAPATFLGCRLVRPVIAPWDPIRIEAEVEVHRGGARLDASVEIALPMRATAVTAATSTTPIPELGEAGRYRLHGTTSPIPADQGIMHVLVGLADAGRHQLSDVTTHELRIDAPPRSGNPYLQLVPTWSIEPTAPASTLRSIRAGLAEGADVVATARGITKRFPSRDGLRRAALAIPGRRARTADEVVALDDVTIEVETGSALGLIGANGAGKSTFLRVLAGVTRPEAGEVEVTGRVVPVLELGLGFHPDLTGEQNVRLSGRLLGMTAAEVDERLEPILALAALVEVRDVEVKRYSTGMRARLGFALAMHAGGDLLLLDELLAVGDEDFRRQAIDAVRQRRDGGATVVFVSHQLRQVIEVCDRVVRLERGRVVDDGTPAEVVGRYGGPSWVAGASDAGSSVRLHELALRPHHVPTGGRIEFEGVLELGRPEPDVRLELAYRAPRTDDDPAADLEAAIARSFFVATVVPAGGLPEPGWYRFAGAIDDNQFAGTFDLVLSAIDERDDVIVAEAWQPATVGMARPEGFPGPVLDVEWQVERLDRVVAP